MKLFAFKGPETDWVAAPNEDVARVILMRHYGISDDDIAGNYEVIEEVDPTTLKMYPEDWDYEDDEAEPPTAAEYMAEPGLVGSTCQP
jgi:hypothetical protein